MKECRRLYRTFACLEDERNALPPRVVDPEGGSGIRGADRVGWDRVIIEITGLPIYSDILTKQRIFTLNGRNRTKDLDLQVTGVNSREKLSFIRR